jgi:hypothetical protein
MRKLLLTLIAGAAIVTSAGWSASAHDYEPGYWLKPSYHYAWVRLKYGSARALYEEKCAVWNWQQQSWYNICVGPKPVSAKY